jgi:hypothetical protein
MKANDNGNHHFKPGEIFWEKTYTQGRNFIHHIAGQQPERGINAFDIDLEDRLDGAVRAEIAAEYWGGHIGTSEQQFRINGSEWFDLPQPADTPTSPFLYFRVVLGNPPVDIPAGILKNGLNRIEVKAGKQIKYGWYFDDGIDGGMYWVYAITVRIYYDSDYPHISGHITSPVSGAQAGDNPVLTVEADDELGFVGFIDFIGRYKDFDWTGMGGGYDKWYYSLMYGRMFNHIGRVMNDYKFSHYKVIPNGHDKWQVFVPYTLRWDTSLLPDQDAPVSVVAKITDQDNVSYITDAVEFEISRENRSVKMYAPSEVPECFGSHFWYLGRECIIEMPDDLKNAEKAWLVMSNWSFAHVKEVKFNGTLIASHTGYVHNFSYARLDVPLGLIQKTNKFYILNDEQNHPAEVNWPGPCLFVQYSSYK